MEKIVLVPEVITHLGPLPVTNTLIVSWIVVVVISVLAYFATKNIEVVPNRFLQNVFELVIEAFYDLTEGLAHSRAKEFFPFLMTFFLFILVGNWIGLLPGFATIGFFHHLDGQTEFVPLLRSMNTDLNNTLGLALLSAVITHYYSIKHLGIKGYLSHWFNINPIFMFVGVLELISELTKIVSLSFRLFGNIFAGEVVLSTISSIFAFGIPIPFYLLEILVGVIQASVFMILTMVFMTLLSEKHTGEEENHG